MGLANWGMKKWFTTWVVAASLPLAYGACKKEIEHRDRLDSIKSAIEQRVEEHESTYELKPSYMKPAEVGIPKYLKRKPGPFDPSAKVDEELMRNYIRMGFVRVGDVPVEISEDYVRKLIEVESHDRPHAVSWVGARGLTQMMPDTWANRASDISPDWEKEIPYDCAFEPSTSIEMGIRQLKFVENRLEANNSNWNKYTLEKRRKLISAGYNGGHVRVMKKGYNINRMPRETRHYVRKISSRS